jgi:N-acetylglutamate synthase-like GNAT family acetyltransferase
MLRISSDPAELEVGLIHDFLSRHSYWAADIPLSTLERALANSVCYGGYVDGAQVAFARAVTDQATFAYLADVFVVPAHRGKGYGRDIVRALMEDSRRQGLRRWHLVTRDMQGMYAQFGFTALSQPELHMQKHDPDVYRRVASKPA